MRSPSRFIATTCLWLSFFAAISLQAHSVWIEPLPDDRLALRFGEWGEQPETSPGHLDALIQPTAAIERDGTHLAVELSKETDHYLLTAALATESVTGQCNYGVMKRGGGPARRPIFYARWWPAQRPTVSAPASVLDLLPSAAKPGQVLVSFHGKPVAAEVELTFYPPSGAGVKLLTDSTGHVTLPEVMDAGLCLLTLGRFSEDAPGTFQGEAYEIASHSASLSWRVEKAPASN
jgi:hypothetical protein